MKLLYVLIAGAVLLGALAVYSIVQDERQWEVYRVTHHCSFVGSRVQLMPVMVGKSVMEQAYTISTFACDGGVEVERMGDGR